MYMTLRGYVCVNVRSYTYNRLYKHGEVINHVYRREAKFSPTSILSPSLFPSVSWDPYSLSLAVQRRIRVA